MAGHLPPEKHDSYESPTEYEKLNQILNNRLLAQRHQGRENKQTLEDMQRYPGWNMLTISNLHNLFSLFAENRNGMLDFDGFSAVLNSLGDESSCEYRKQKFDETDMDLDGLVSYEEYLDIVYNFNKQNGNTLTGLAKLVYDATENTKFVSSLSVGEQLEYNLI